MDFQLPPDLKLLYAGTPPAEREIQLTEEVIGRVLPDEFKSLAGLANGGQPSPNRLNLGPRTLYVDFFLAFGVGPIVSSPPPEALRLKKSARKLLKILNEPHEARLRDYSFEPADSFETIGLNQTPVLAEGDLLAEETANSQFVIDPQEAITIVEVWRDLERWLPQELIPIAAEAEGGYFCYDYRKPPPVIVFWDPFKVWPLAPVADSLQSFLKRLAADSS